LALRYYYSVEVADIPVFSAAVASRRRIPFGQSESRAERFANCQPGPAGDLVSFSRATAEQPRHVSSLRVF
jgi:hypothetical protein